jgi:UDP-N-acetylmuramoyl-tripeptide--D-alanyl-D-alanine ligase
VEITQLYQLYLQYPSIQTDTRKIKQGDLFFALKGPNFNGNQFVKEALTKGAAYAIVDEPIDGSNDRIIVTTNALSTLQNLAKHHRQQFNIPFITITGSNGKTTTKELVSTVLASHFTTYTTQGNLNNHIGVPLTILSIPLNAQMAVIEMGANHQKEIESYCTYTLPTHGIITNCGKAHLEGFGGEEGIKKGKSELYDYLKKNNGTAFVYWDYDYLQTMSIGIPNIIKYGTIDGIVTGKVHSNNPFLAVSINKETPLSTIYTQLVGDYNLPNILCAVTIGKYFKVPDEKIKTAIENYIPSNSRSQLLEKGNNKIILDAYNANPTSMKAAIENFAAIVTDKKKIIFIGAMMEMGEQSIQEHEQIIALLQQFKWEQVILVGGDFKRVQHPFLYMNNSIEAKAYYSEQKFENSFCLIKGSRSIQMEKILD